jgi:hypothetical protein
MVKKFAQVLLALAPSLLLRGQTAAIDVHFKLTDLEYKPLANVPVRLAFSGGQSDWQGAEAGNRFVTDVNGEAHFAATAAVDRRWNSQNVGLTGVSLPIRTDHVFIAAELERTFPGIGALRWVYTMDVFRDASGDCSTSDIDAIYTKDAKGRFARKIEQTRLSPGLYSWKAPELKGMVFSAPGYQAWDFMLSPEDGAERKRWKLKLSLKRAPEPVRR